MRHRFRAYDKNDSDLTRPLYTHVQTASRWLTLAPDLKAPQTIDLQLLQIVKPLERVLFNQRYVILVQIPAADKQKHSKCWHYIATAKTSVHLRRHLHIKQWQEIWHSSLIRWRSSGQASVYFLASRVCTSLLWLEVHSQNQCKCQYWKRPVKPGPYLTCQPLLDETCQDVTSVSAEGDRSVPSRR